MVEERLHLVRLPVVFRHDVVGFLGRPCRRQRLVHRDRLFNLGGSGRFFGLLGGYTTYSTFTAETIVLARTGSTVAAFGNVAISLLAGVTAAFAGVIVGESLGG